MQHEELYNRLYLLRENLKKEHLTNGRAPVVCSDEALIELAKTAPRHKEDLINVNGLGETFVERYGEYFMAVIDSFYAESSKEGVMSEAVKTTLSNLENRLVNISKKNRLLYMPKTYNNFSFDMFQYDDDYNQKVLNLLMGKGKSLVVSQISPEEDNQTENAKRFKKLSNLLREVTREYRESGLYNLYIGYPFVMGKTKGEDFDVRAPLCLFPIEFEKTSDKISIKLDKTRDALLNSNLLLTQFKFLSKNDELPSNILEDLEEGEFLDKIKEYYQLGEIDIKGELGNLKKLEEYTAKEFPKYNKGEFYLFNNAVLGMFSLYSSALQRDFRIMINSPKINLLVDELLSGIENIDIYAEDSQLKESEEILNFNEKDLNYINELNSSQEQAILNMANKDKLVVQGPPGTGKSQTITSLIADSVNKGLNVVMVSQKKAALDVIYSRLGNLSNFTIMLNDVKDKENFYKQLYNLFACNKENNFKLSSFENASNKIDAHINTLEKIAKKVYTEKIQGTEIYKIYLDNINNNFKNDQSLKEKYLIALTSEILQANYQDLKNLKNKFLNEKVTSVCCDYVRVTSQYKWLLDMKDFIKFLARNKMLEESELFNKNQKEYLNSNIFKKIFNKSKRKKELQFIFDNYFKNNNYFKYLFQNPTELENGCKEYVTYQSSKATYNELSRLEKIYFNTIYNLANGDKNLIVNENKIFFDFIVYSIIDDFENENRQLINEIDNFDDTIKDISKLMNNKKDLSKERMKATLSESFYQELTFSKRYNEMCRLIENNRKWSVSKFVKKFGFELFRGIKVWLMTPETVSEVLPLEEGLFDLLIFDEASQIYVEKGIPAIARAKKVLIAGDHKQLRPSSLGFGRIDVMEEENLEENDEPNAALEEESLLDLARFKYPSVLLNYHYRAKYEELINFSNYAFYKGRLNVSPNIEQPIKPPIEVIKIENGLWTKRSNKEEAVRTVEEIKKFLNERKNKETLGVITFNVNQRDLILDELDKECLKDPKFANICKKEFERKENGEDIGLFVKNIENVQGDERDCIIFSIGYAKNEEGKVIRNYGWLNQMGGENRLNVAISRAKRKIIIVTSVYPEELKVDDLTNDGPKLFKKYLEYCFAINNRDTETARRILFSFANSEKEITEASQAENDIITSVCSALTERGLLVEREIGIGEYKLAIAIKNNENKYLFGIEFDNRLYNLSCSTRERDIFRQKYFEARGWQVYRLWSKNWWHNSEKEIEKILEKYNKLNNK